MTLESADGIVISIARTVRLLREHGARMSDLIDDLGLHETYLATDVLEWLGY